MGKEGIQRMMAALMMGIGQINRRMVMEYRSMQMEISTKAILKMESSLEKVSLRGQMAKLNLEIGMKEN